MATAGDASRSSWPATTRLEPRENGPGSGCTRASGSASRSRIVRTRPCYVALFDIDTSFKVTLLSSDEPSGWRLAPGQTKVVGGPDGVALAWDENVPRTGERLETLVVVAATEPQQFGLLETPRDAGTRGVGLSELEALLVEAGDGNARLARERGRRRRGAVPGRDDRLLSRPRNEA